MVRSIVLASFLFLSSLSRAQEYLGLYLQGSKIGYASYETVSEELDGRKVARSNSYTVMETKLLGTAMRMTVESSTWTGPDAKPIRMRFVSASAGRTQTVKVEFKGAKAAVEIANQGQEKIRRTLDLPNGSVVDDPLRPLVENGLIPGGEATFYVFDPVAITFQKTEAKVVGPAGTKVLGQDANGVLVRLKDRRVTLNAFLTSKGDLIKVDGPFGIEMVPVSKEVALDPAKNATEIPDLALRTSIPAEPPLRDGSRLSKLHLRLKGVDLAGAPSDAHQTLRREGEAWEMRIHPVSTPSGSGKSIKEVGQEQKEWLASDIYIPAGNEAFKRLVKEIVGNRTKARDAAEAIHIYVHRRMATNAGIGVLRDASEILQTWEGVCRDHAVLMTTLLRTAGVPTRLVSGLVSWDGPFFYHAWVEFWDGSQWVGVDSTAPDFMLSASHLKLGQGTVEQAFTFSFLEGVKIEVLSSARR